MGLLNKHLSTGKSVSIPRNVDNTSLQTSWLVTFSFFAQTFTTHGGGANLCSCVLCLFPGNKRISIGLKMGAASELAFAVFLISFSSGGWISVGKITGFVCMVVLEILYYCTQLVIQCVMAFDRDTRLILKFITLCLNRDPDLFFLFINKYTDTSCYVKNAICCMAQSVQ